MYAQPAGEDTLAGWVRRSLHDVSFRGSKPKAKPEQPVGHQVHQRICSGSSSGGMPRNGAINMTANSPIGGDEILMNLRMLS